MFGEVTGFLLFLAVLLKRRGYNCKYLFGVVIKLLTDKNILFIETLLNADIFLINKQISLFLMTFCIQTVLHSLNLRNWLVSQPILNRRK